MNWKSPHKARRIALILDLIAAMFAVFAWAGCRSIPITVVFVCQGIAIGLIIAGEALMLLYWRCPECGRLLPYRASLLIEFCPYCGERIDIERKQ